MTRRTRVLGLCVGLVLSLGSTSAVVAARPASEHCISPGGDDLNEIFATSDALVAPFCREIRTGEPWRAVLRVNMAGEADRVFPDGYVPLESDLDADLLAKLQAVTYVVDAGTRRERTYVVPAEDLVIRTGDVPDGTRFVGWISTRRHPLPPGDHTVDQYVTLSSDFWDGLALDPALNLVPAGRSFAASFEFTVENPRRS